MLAILDEPIQLSFTKARIIEVKRLQLWKFQNGLKRRTVNLDADKMKMAKTH